MRIRVRIDSGGRRSDCGAALAATAPQDLEAALSYPFQQDLGLRKVGRYDRLGPEYSGRAQHLGRARPGVQIPGKITHNTADDGQELTGLALSADGKRLVWARGGDHDANWPAAGGLEPNPQGDPTEPKVTIWTALVAAGEPTEGHRRRRTSTLRDRHAGFHQGSSGLDRDARPQGVQKDCSSIKGRIGDLAWSPRGDRLAFVSDRGDHSFIGVYTAKECADHVLWRPPPPAPFRREWSPDGTRIAFVRVRGGSAWPESMMTDAPEPWSIWTAGRSRRRRVAGMEESQYAQRLLSGHGWRGKPVSGWLATGWPSSPTSMVGRTSYAAAAGGGSQAC